MRLTALLRRALFNISDALTNVSTVSTASRFAIGQNGVSTPQSSTRDLWFRLDMPPTTSTTAQQQMTVTITASTPHVSFLTVHPFSHAGAGKSWRCRSFSA